MMRRLATTSFLAAALLLTVLALPAFAQGVESEGRAVVIEALELDATEIIFQGEAIGDILHSGQGHVWVNVLGSDGVALGIWVDRTDTEAISVLGRYGYVGDTVRTVGTLNAACDQHGGDLDVHATSLEVMEEGHVVEHEPQPIWAVLGGIGVVVAFGLSRAARARRLRAPGVRHGPL